MTVKRHTIANLRWLWFAVFPIGWSASYGLLNNEQEYYALLTVISMAATFVILLVLGRDIKREVHLWLIFILYLLGYFVKFYLLCYMKINSHYYGDYLNIYFQLESDLLNRTELIIRYFEIVTTVLVSYAMTISILVLGNRRHPITTNIELANERTQLKVKERTIWRLLFITIIISLCLISLQVQLGLGLVSGSDRQVVELPYHLAGIIMTVYNGLIPLLFLIVLWLSDTIRARLLARISTGCYLIFGIVAGLISTSKSLLISVVMSMLVLWLIIGSFTKRRAMLFISIVPFIMIFNSFLSANRILRRFNPDTSIFDISIMIVQSFFSGNVISFDDESVRQIASVLGLIMRINGADSLLNIINYNPSFSIDRILYLLKDAPDAVNVFYTSDVLERGIQTGLAFSTSLIGYFLFVFGNVWIVCSGMIIYTLFWHILFRLILNARLIMEPIVFALLIVTLGFYTSEGTLETMPQSIAVITAFGLLGEFIVRRLFRRDISRITYPVHPRTKLIGFH